jgi:hypothetical protein
MATRNIFSRLRVTGYPQYERENYHHSWFNPDVEDADEEEVDDGTSADGGRLQNAINI